MYNLLGSRNINQQIDKYEQKIKNVISTPNVTCSYFNPYRTNIFCPENVVCCLQCTSAAYINIQVHIRAVIHLQFWAYGSWDSLHPI